MWAELRVSSECICEASLLWSLWFAEMACVRWAKQTWVSSSSPVQIRHSRTNGKALMKSCRLWMDRCHCQHHSVLLLCPVPPLSSLLQWGIVAMEALFQALHDFESSVRVVLITIGSFSNHGHLDWLQHRKVNTNLNDRKIHLLNWNLEKFSTGDAF